MKKILIVALTAFVSACSCFDCYDEEPVTTYQSSRQAKMDCDYFDGKTCYRYVYKTVQRPVVQPNPIRYRQCGSYQPAAQPVSCNYGRAVSTCNSCNSCRSCEAKVSETREPVEVVYKKTTYKTVYEPKTYSQVSYEKAPYHSVSEPEQVEVINDDQLLVEDVK